MRASELAKVLEKYGDREVKFAVDKGYNKDREEHEYALYGIEWQTKIKHEEDPITFLGTLVEDDVYIDGCNFRPIDTV